MFVATGPLTRKLLCPPPVIWGRKGPAVFFATGNGTSLSRRMPTADTSRYQTDDSVLSRQRGPCLVYLVDEYTLMLTNELVGVQELTTKMKHWDASSFPSYA